MTKAETMLNSRDAPKLGGPVEFYRSPVRVAWTPTGTNVPDYPKLAQLWRENIGEAVSGDVTVDTAMDNLARQQDKVMARRLVTAPRAIAVPSSTTRSAPRSGSPGPARPKPSWPTRSRRAKPSIATACSKPNARAGCAKT